MRKVSVSVFLVVLACAAVFSAPVNEAQFAQALGSALENGSVEDALLLFEKMPAGLENDVDLQILRASLLLSAGRDTEAESLAAALLSSAPKNVDVLGLNVMIAKKNGNSAQKTQFLRQILQVDPQNPDANIELGSEQALKRNYRSARDYYRKALAADPENEEALFGFGKMSYYLEKDDDAKKSFNKILEINSQNASALSYLAKFEAEKLQYRKAVEYVNKAIQYEPDNGDYYLDLGTYSRFSGKYDDAEKAWKKAVELEPDYFLGYAYLAGLCEEQDRRADALAYYKKVVEKNPEYYYAYESIAMFEWEKGNYSAARAAFDAAGKGNSGSISYKLMTAACLIKEKKIQECRTYTEKVMKGMDRNSIEYLAVRLFHDMSGDAPFTLKVQNETNRTTRTKMLFYLAVYWELKGNSSLAHKYYAEVADVQGASFFEARLAQWANSAR